MKREFLANEAVYRNLFRDRATFFLIPLSDCLLRYNHSKMCACPRWRRSLLKFPPGETEALLCHEPSETEDALFGRNMSSFLAMPLSDARFLFSVNFLTMYSSTTVFSVRRTRCAQTVSACGAVGAPLSASQPKLKD